MLFRSATIAPKLASMRLTTYRATLTRKSYLTTFLIFTTTPAPCSASILLPKARTQRQPTTSASFYRPAIKSTIMMHVCLGTVSPRSPTARSQRDSRWAATPSYSCGPPPSEPFSGGEVPLPLRWGDPCCIATGATSPAERLTVCVLCGLRLGYTVGTPGHVEENVNESSA